MFAAVQVWGRSSQPAMRIYLVDDIVYRYLRKGRGGDDENTIRSYIRSLQGVISSSILMLYDGLNSHSVQIAPVLSVSFFAKPLHLPGR